MRPVSILLLQGDAEARLFAGAGPLLQGALPQCAVSFTCAWSTRPDLIDTQQPDALARRGVLPAVASRELLAEPYRMVILSLLPLVTMPVLRHRAGGAFLAHRGLLAQWPAAQLAAPEYVEQPPLEPADAASAIEPLVERLQNAGAAVALCNSLRHVREPLQHRRSDSEASLRELVRRTNLEVARLSLRTGCFVIDVDRPLAHEGGAALDADCFGGDGRAAELAIDELLAVVFDALPDDVMPLETG